MRYLLQAAGSGDTKLHVVIRAPQHSGIPNPMMRRLLAGRGRFRHWQETDSAVAQSAESAALANQLEAAASWPLPEGSGWTLNVVPDSV